MLARLSFLLAAQAAGLAGPAEEYVDAQLRVVKGLEEQAPALIRAADAAAQRLLAGGTLYLAGERGLVAELNGRAAGLCAAKAFAPGKTQLAAKDIVLFSDTGARLGDAGPAWAAITAPGVLRIPFLSREHYLLKKLGDADAQAISVDIPLDSRLVALPDGTRLLPTATPALAIAQWAFVAEMIGACRRQGKQLAVYLSIHLDEGRKRFERTKGLLFDPDLKPEPAPAGRLAREFLGHVRSALEAVRKDEAAKMRTAADWLRKAKAGGRKVVRHLYGHLPPTEAGVPGDPPCFTDTAKNPPGDQAVAWMQKNLGRGDVYLFIGYQQNEDAMAAAANQLGVRTIFLTSLPPGGAQAESPLHLYVNPHWPVTDGCVELPGYDVKACPLSGILGMTVYYAICAEAIAPR